MMDRITNILLSLLLFSTLLFSGCGSGKIPDHPRLIIDRDDFNRKGQQNEYLQKLENLLLEKSDSIIDLPLPERILTGRRLLHVSRTYLKRISYLSYAWQLTGEKKYLEKAEELMVHASSFSDWNPSHFLDVAEMTLALSIGYDWLYQDMKEETREIAAKAIIEKGLLPSVEKEHSWLTNNNNWNQVCNASLAFGAWAVYEMDTTLAEKIIRRTGKNILIPQHEYEPDGAYPEGANYWTYGTSFNVLFIEAWEKINGYGTAETGPGFRKSGEYFLHVFGPGGNFNYSDGNIRGELSPPAFWFAYRNNDPGLIYNQLRLLDKLVSGEKILDPANENNRLFPFTLLWLGKLEQPDRIKPEKLSWTGGGLNPVSMHRTGWDENDIFIGIKGGSPSLSHAHMDAGSFVMDALGERWVMDLGAHDYHKLESQGVGIWDGSPEGDRWKILRYNNYAHSTLVVDGKLQVIDSDSRIVKTIDNENEKGAVVDISDAYRGQLAKAVRSLSILDASRVEIRDSIHNNEVVSELRWAILTVDSLEYLSENEVIIIRNGKKLNFKIESPEGIAIETFSSQPQNDFEDKNPGTVLLGFRYKMAANEKTIIRVILEPQ